MHLFENRLKTHWTKLSAQAVIHFPLFIETFANIERQHIFVDTNVISFNKHSVLRRQSRDRNRNIKWSLYCQYGQYWQYNDHFIFRFGSTTTILYFISFKFFQYNIHDACAALACLSHKEFGTCDTTCINTNVFLIPVSDIVRFDDAIVGKASEISRENDVGILMI